MDGNADRRLRFTGLQARHQDPDVEDRAQHVGLAHRSDRQRYHAGSPDGRAFAANLDPAADRSDRLPDPRGRRDGDQHQRHALQQPGRLDLQRRHRRRQFHDEHAVQLGDQGRLLHESDDACSQHQRRHADVRPSRHHEHQHHRWHRLRCAGGKPGAGEPQAERRREWSDPVRLDRLHGGASRPERLHVRLAAELLDRPLWSDHGLLHQRHDVAARQDRTRGLQQSERSAPYRRQHVSGVGQLRRRGTRLRP